MSVLHGSSAMGVLMTAALTLVALTGCGGGSAFRPSEDTSGGRIVPGAEGAPTITMIMPTTDKFVFQGDTVQMSWVDTDPDDNAEVTVFAFLDDDRNQVPDTGAVTLVLGIVSEDPDGVSDMYTWLTGGFPEGTYTVGAIIDDFDNPPATDFALGQVIISAQQSLTLDLGRIGTRFAGILWRGWNSGDMAGYAMDGGMDVNGDGFEDMIIISRFGDPFYFRPGAGPYGEGYLIHGQLGRLVEREQELNSVAAVIPGTIYAAPRAQYGADVTENGSSGIMSVAMVPNIEIVPTEDPIGGAEIVFGIPFMDGLLDEVDLDDQDNNELNEGAARFCIPDYFNPGQSVEIPVGGVTGYFWDTMYLNWFHYEWTYEGGICVNENYDPVCDPNAGGSPSDPNCTDPNNGIQFIVVPDQFISIDLPWVLTEPGFLVYNEDCTGYETDAFGSAFGYALGYGPDQSSDGGGDGYVFRTGVAIFASSVANTSGNLDGAIIDLTKVGGTSTSLYGEAWGSTWGHGAKFRPPYTYAGQDEIDNWNGWEYLNDSYHPNESALIPSDWAHTVGWSDLDGDDRADLLIGAPRMPHRNTWDYSYTNPLLLHQGYTANVINNGPVDTPYQLIHPGKDFTDVQVGDKVIIHHGSGELEPVNYGTYLATGSSVDKVFLDADPGLSIIYNPDPNGIPPLMFADDVWYMIPNRNYRSNDVESGGIAVVGSSLWQPDGPYDLAWYHPDTDPDAANPQPSWPNLRATTGGPPPNAITASLGCDDNVTWNPRTPYYPFTDFLFGDAANDGAATALDPLRATDRWAAGGQLGGVTEILDNDSLGVVGPATAGTTGLAAFDPNTGATISDFNMDGLDDLACGAPGAHPAGKQEAGIAYVAYGRRPFGWHDAGEIDNPTPQQHLPGIELEGTVAGDRTGTAQARVAYYKPERQRVVDFNGDGVADWLIGVPGRDPLGRTDAGMVAVVFGHDRFHPIDGSFTLDQLNTDTNGPLGDPDGVLDEWDLRAVKFNGERPGDELGYFVAGIGDANADGFADILVSAPGHDYDEDGDGYPERWECGKVYLIYGSSWFTDPANPTDTYDLRNIATGGFPDGLPGKSYVGPVDPDPEVALRIGPVARAGDVDSDGFDDYLIGSPYATQLPNKPEAGACYLIYGTPADQP